MSEEDDDTALVYNLLNGHRGKFGKRTFPKHNSEDERKALKALAQMLYESAHRAANPLDRRLQIMLAELFNPDGHIVRGSDDQVDQFRGMIASERKVEFRLRTNQRQVPMFRDEGVYDWMQERVDEGARVKKVSVKKVKNLAMQKFGLSAEKIRVIWLKGLKRDRFYAACEKAT